MENLKKMYFCDPNKNTECSKSGCFINGGPCYKTAKPEFKLEPNDIPESQRCCSRCVYESVYDIYEPCVNCSRNIHVLKPDHFIAKEEN